MKLNYDYAAEMLKITESEEHQKLFTPMVKEAFSREGKEEPSEVEEEMKKLQKSASTCDCKDPCKEECKCECHEKDKAKADDGNYALDAEKVASPSDAVQALMKISEHLEAQGMEKFAAASLLLAEAIVKEAKKKVEKSKSKDKAKSKAKSKPMTQKERMEAMRKAKAKKDKASKSSGSGSASKSSGSSSKKSS